MKNYLCQKINMLSVLIICLVVGGVAQNAFAQSPPNTGLYWYIAKPNDNPTIGNSINGTSTLGFVPNTHTTTNADFLPSTWRDTGIFAQAIDQGTWWEITPHDKGLGLFLFGHWGNWGRTMWWSTSIYTKEELSKDIDVINSIAINVVNDYNWNKNNPNGALETNEYVVFVYETNDATIEAGNSTNIYNNPNNCMYLPSITDRSINMDELYSPMQIENNAWLNGGDPRNATDADVDAYVQHWLEHNAYLIERKNITITEFTDNAWIEFSTDNAGRAGYKYKGGNLVVVMLQTRRTSTASSTGNQQTMHTVMPGWDGYDYWIRNYGAEDRCWYGYKSSINPDNNYQWIAENGANNNRGAGIWSLRLGVDAVPNDYVSTFPGENMSVAQSGTDFNPRVYHSHPGIDRAHDVAKFSYKILNSAGEVVYRGKSGSDENDTLIAANPYTEYTEITMAEGDYARSNGQFILSPDLNIGELLPDLGNYQIVVTWQTFAEAGTGTAGLFPTRQKSTHTVNFDIVLPITTVTSVRPTWNTPIVVGQPLPNSLQPSVTTNKPADETYMPTITYSISTAAKDADGNFTGELDRRVYEAYNSLNALQIDIDQSTIGEYTHNFINARGPAADVNNPGRLDGTKLEAGKYYVSFTSSYKGIPEGSSEDINNLKYDSFWVAPINDLELVSILSPNTTDGTGGEPGIGDSSSSTIGLEYTFPANTDLALEYVIRNLGSQTCSTHVFTAEIYNLAGALVTTVKDTSNVSLAFYRSNSIKCKKTFSLTNPSIYTIKARVDFVGDAAVNSEINKTDNIYPRDEFYPITVDPTQTKKIKRFFRIQPAYSVSLADQVYPSSTASSYRYPTYPTIKVINSGSTDVNGLIVTLTVTKPGTGDTVLVESKPLSNIKVNSTESTNFAFNTLFFPDTTGIYNFKYTYHVPGAADPYSTTKFANILGGLGNPNQTTIYTIGRGGSFITIRSALEALYTRGVQGHVVFEINAEPDPETGQLTVDASYLDLRSKIVGAGPNATITFRPSPAMMTEAQPVILLVDPATYTGNAGSGLRSEDWFGVAFGDASRPRIDVAAVNHVIEPEWKRFFAESNGYITLDGGDRKNFQIKYEGKYMNETGRWLLAPIYLGAGSNHITVKNCRIIAPTTTAAATMPTSFDIPATYYDDPNYHVAGQHGFRYEPLSINDNTANVYTTAGIFMHARPLDQVRFDNVLYTFNKNTSNNNTIEGNYIHGFGYGIFTLGMGANIDADTIKPMYNKGNRIADNLITLSGSTGIFLGFEENAVVSHNRITNVTGSLSNVAGIRLGHATDELRVPDNQGNPNTWKYDGIELNMNNYNVTIERNEISNIRGYQDGAAYGILITEPVDTLQHFNRQYSPLDQLASSYNTGISTNVNNSYRIVNNLIYDVVSSGGSTITTSRAGLAVLPSAAGVGILPDDNSYYNHARHKINKVQVANNTIILDDKLFSDLPGSIDCDNLYVAGIKLFDAKSYEIINNAIAIKIDTTYKYRYISALALRSPNPKTLASNININNNAYSVFEPIDGYPTTGQIYNENTAFVRFFELDKYGRILNEDGGFAQEYNKLRNWYAWTGSDKNSLEYNFLKEMESDGSKLFWSENVTTVRRMLSTTAEKVSQLDKGFYIDYVATDIDGTNRQLLGKYFNIGAMEFASRHNNYDMAVIAISQPVAYLNPQHIYSAEEQIMLPGERQNQDIQPKAIIKNNGTIPLSNVPVVCRIQSSETTPRFSISDTVWTNLPIGEEKEITFFTRSTNRFTPQTYREAGVILTEIDQKYYSMLNNVSPVYNIEIGFDANFNLQYGDANKLNDMMSMNARFFAPRSVRSLLVSAKHSHEELYVNDASGNRIGVETNREIIAGRLNYDTVVAALAHIGLVAPADESDPIYYDVLERTAWEPRAVVYDQYSGVIYSDALNDAMDYWEKKPLLDYVNNATITNKRTLIVGSEGVLAENNDANDPFDKELSDNMLRSKTPQTISYPGNIVITGDNHNRKLDIELANTGYEAINQSNQQIVGDAEPNPHSFTIVDTVLGLSNIAYHLKNNTEAVVVASSKLLEKNMIHSAIDWRHLKNAAAFMEGIFGDVGNDINRPTDGLGIELSDFNANANGKKVLVDWTTLSEGGIANFEVQRADVSNNLSGLFTSIASKRAKGVDNVTSNYNIFDENVNYGQEYAYRLKINDVEGKYTYSPIKIVNIEYANGMKFGDIAPNPVSDHYAKTDFTLTKEANVIVTINDLSGKEVMTLWSGFANAGTHPLTIDASKLAAGTYTIIYNIDGNVVKTDMFNVAK